MLIFAEQWGHKCRTKSQEQSNVQTITMKKRLVAKKHLYKEGLVIKTGVRGMLLTLKVDTMTANSPLVIGM